MKEINIIAPVKKPEDILKFSENTRCKDYYVYYNKFLNGNFEYIKEFVTNAKSVDCRIFVNFKHDIVEEELPEIKKFLKYLKNSGIDGIFINSFAVLEAIKVFKFPFQVIADSYFDIHNLAGIDFINSFHKVTGLIITEEIYLKNILKIKKYTRLPLAIDSDNLPWCAEDIIKLKAIDSVVIKGKFKSSDDILEGIELIENILDKPKLFKNQKLPFKHVRKSIYKTNHFSGDIVSAEGKDFKFSRNIKSFNWDESLNLSERYKNYIDKLPLIDKNKVLKLLEKYRINLRLTSLSQTQELKKYIEDLGFNPVYSIEYGEIVSTSDLSSRSFSEVITYVKDFCAKYDIKFQLSTPSILIERDFDRVYEYEKQLLLSEPEPSSLIINNIGYFWSFINDPEVNYIPFEIGQGINLLNSMSIKCLNELAQIDTIDFTPFKDISSLEKMLKKIKNEVPNKKYTIAGNIRVSSMGLCPLNNDSAIVSRLSCKAPCYKGQYALKDPSLKKNFPFVCDGFCRMHMFEDCITDDFSNLDKLYDIGINEFIFDFSSLDAKYISILFNKFFDYVSNVK